MHGLGLLSKYFVFIILFRGDDTDLHASRGLLRIQSQKYIWQTPSPSHIMVPLLHASMLWHPDWDYGIHLEDTNALHRDVALAGYHGVFAMCSH